MYCIKSNNVNIKWWVENKNANPEASKNSTDENVTVQTTLALPRTTGTFRLSHVRIYECDTRVIITFRVYGLMSVRGGGGADVPLFATVRACHAYPVIRFLPSLIYLFLTSRISY